MLTIKKPSQMRSARPKVYCKKTLPLLEGSVTMLVSNGGLGKTACSILLAIDYVNETGGKVALWLTEDSEGETFRRYKQLVADHKKEPAFFNDRISLITSPPIRFNKLQDGNAILTEEYYQIKEELSDYGMIVLDPLLQFNGCDENSNSHAGVLMGALKTWAAEADKVIMLLHHVTFFQDGTIKARGAGEWQNGCRCVYSIAYPAISKMPGQQAEPDRGSNMRVFEMIKDNGIGYRYFTNSEGEKERVLQIFPEEDTPF